MGIFTRRLARLCAPVAALAITAALPGPAAAQDNPSAAHPGTGVELKLGALVIAEPWARATPPAAKVGGGYLRITNTGTEPDRLVGMSAPVAGRGEIHEMAVVDGVMRMRELEDGIAIAPGQTVELKPGGLHVMFMDIQEPLKEGATIPVTLRFAKAGTIEVPFQVRSIGAGSRAKN
ncbi:copper chaperone PCu(A)C [Blastochloris sulfoviridis]|nr:copper chaperone PCu(A)C [Blastochloris sulfoviridis]